MRCVSIIIKYTGWLITVWRSRIPSVCTIGDCPDVDKIHYQMIQEFTISDHFHDTNFIYILYARTNIRDTFKARTRLIYRLRACTTSSSPINMLTM